MTILGTAGHVDHGKSSLVEALTGVHPDRLAEERRRGLTIDLGFAHTVLPSGRKVSIVDVPGHVRFLHNMLAGVGGIAGCVFVVDASEGWKPQSEEHLRILELLGAHDGVVALTKVDLLDAAALDAARADVGARLTGSFLADAPRVAVSTVTGQGIGDLVTAVDALCARATAPVDRSRPRLWIDRVFAAAGSGTVVTGTLTGGRLRVGDAVTVQPGDLRCRVRGVQTAGSAVDEVGPGTRVALNLAGVGHAELDRGAAVVEPSRWRTTGRVDASLRVLASLTHDVTRRGAFALHVGTAEVAVRLRVLGADDAIEPGASGLVRLHLAGPLPLLPGDRYVLRESGRSETVGGGEVLDIDPVLPARDAAPDRSVQRVVRERGWVTVDELEGLTGERVAPNVGQWVAAPPALATLRAAVQARIEGAGPAGVDLASLDDRERALVDGLDRVVVERGVARSVEARDPYAAHPALDLLRTGGLMPGDPGIPRGEVRELVQRGLAVERDRILFHPDAITAAATVAASLLVSRPDGFTVAEFRDATGTTRKFALPLVAELDARGVTRRRGDHHVAGPRLPDPPQPNDPTAE